MGLDMYLYTNSRKVSEEVNDRSDEWEGGFMVPRGIAAQWRKANAVHAWFVREVQGGNDDCGIYEVSASELARLHDACKEVLESTELTEAMVENGRVLQDGLWMPNMERGQVLADPTKARELLPTQEGFFFGSTSYDQWYWWDLQYTQRKLAAILDCLVPTGDCGWQVEHKDEPGWYVRFCYTSSW